MLGKDRRIALAHNLAEVIDALYRHDAPLRDHDRMIALVAKQVDHAMWLAIKHEREGRQYADGS